MRCSARFATILLIFRLHFCVAERLLTYYCLFNEIPHSSECAAAAAEPAPAAAAPAAATSTTPAKAAAPAAKPAAATPASAKKEEKKEEKKEADDDFELFGDDDENDAEYEKQLQARVAAAKEAKGGKEKAKVIAKSLLVLDVKPWGEDTNLDEMEAEVRKIEVDGLLWGKVSCFFRVCVLVATAFSRCGETLVECVCSVEPCHLLIRCCCRYRCCGLCAAPNVSVLL